MSRNETCPECRYYTEDLGEKGYCKLYRHNTSSPDVACPKYEKKETRERKNTLTVEKVRGIVVSEASKYKSSINKMFLLFSVACTTVISILLLIFSVTLCVTIATITEVMLLHRIIFIVVTGSFVISFIVIMGMLISKFRVVRQIIPVITLLLVTGLLIYSNEVWFDFHSLIMNISETIFNVSV